MPEQMKSISEARQHLPGLSQTAQKSMNRYIITHQGHPQSVLLGYDEYQGMKAAAQLLHRPEMVESIRTGLKELEAGNRLSPDEVRNRLQDRARSSETSKLATELADKSGVDRETIATVMATFVNKLMSDFSSVGKVSIPGVGTITVAGKAAEAAGKNGRMKRPRKGKHLVLREEHG